MARLTAKLTLVVRKAWWLPMAFAAIKVIGFAAKLVDSRRAWKIVERLLTVACERGIKIDTR